MKNVFLIEKSPDTFNALKTCFKENDIQYIPFSSLDDALGSQEMPSLMVLLAADSYEDIKKDIDRLKANAAFVKVSRVLVLPFSSSVIESKVSSLDIQAMFQIPVDKLQFLTTISQLLRRGPRRVFRILVTLQREGSNIKYSGVSIDFSETGMAFESAADFQPGEVLQIQFVNPRNRKRFSLEGAIIRRSAAGDSFFYGMKFTGLSEQDIRELMDFITGENRA